MEKFRHYGDAATGIHPFTFVIAPTTAGRIAATCMFPVRLLFSAVFAVLLGLTDTLLWVCHIVYLGVLGRLLLAPLQRAWLRGLLFFIGHVLPEWQSGELNSSSDSRAVAAGDLVVCNLQSVWDAMVLEVMLAQPYHLVCFPDATSATVEGGGRGGGGGTSTSAAAVAAGLRVFPPGPMQRWRVWAHVRRTGSRAFLEAQLPESAAQQAVRRMTEAAELPLHRVQAAAARAGVPVWWFAEGTCSNGRGLLPMPAVTCVSATNTTTAASAGCVVHLATIQYDSPALQNVLGSDVEGTASALFRTGVLLYGSTAPAWTSPFFPTAEVTYRSTRLTRAMPSTEHGPAAAKSCWTLAAPALLELRHAMCQRGQARVVSSGSSAVRRQPLSVGVKEKKGFIEAYQAMLDGSSGKTPA
ncbi:hypothetical protein NESM_000701500 [Novymonas esmeraldas]|uniref:Phospholipid/glycerol acyltransferase domain-containing protein n=1 Tax=Novymonas esmeraldas TaxID=1808958 RepID=A0AAW0EWQ6_9TRYP